MPLNTDGGETAVWRMAAPLSVHLDHHDLYADCAGAEFGSDGALHLEAGGVARLDRLLNVFAHEKWLALTGIEALSVRIRYRGGAAWLTVMCFDGEATREVSSTALPASQAETVVRVPLPGRAGGLVLFQIHADAATVVSELAVVTQAPTPHPVRLGVVITTFNRPAEVEAQLEQLEALDDLGLDYAVHVVDNGRNFTPARPYRRTTVVASPNLGGAGGFTRGLIALMETGGFTHALFMDDDAFCHPEAIARAAAVAGYAEDRRLAFTGAMNFLHDPGLQYELGGALDGYGVRSVRLDVRTDGPEALHGNEAAETPQYGAWWCFLFPLSAVELLPFPFFVRGDDVAFSLQNRFRLETLPGLTAWQPSFEFKIGAAVEYLVHRSFLALPLIAPRPEWTLESVRAGVVDAFSRELAGLRYPMGEAICAALEDLLTGPAFWANAANTFARLKEMGRLEQDFSARSVIVDAVQHDPKKGERRPMRWLRRILGDRSLPARFCPRPPLITGYMTPQPELAFLRPGIVYQAADGSKTLHCRREWRWRRRLALRFARLLDEYCRRYEALRAEYAASPLQSRAAWDARLDLTPAEPAVAHPSV